MWSEELGRAASLMGASDAEKDFLKASASLEVLMLLLLLFLVVHWLGEAAGDFDFFGDLMEEERSRWGEDESANWKGSIASLGRSMGDIAAMLAGDGDMAVIALVSFSDGDFRVPLLMANIDVTSRERRKRKQMARSYYRLWKGGIHYSLVAANNKAALHRSAVHGVVF